MIIDEAKRMAEAKLKCMEREISGVDKDCNNNRCDECALNYEQGNMEEQKEWLRMAIKALEQQIPQTSTIENGFVKCPKCKMYIRFPIADKYNNCPECGQAIKWAEMEEV